MPPPLPPRPPSLPCPARVQEQLRGADSYLFDLDHFIVMAQDTSLSTRARDALPPLPFEPTDDCPALVIDAANTGGRGGAAGSSWGAAGAAGAPACCATPPSHLATASRLPLRAPAVTLRRQRGALHQPQLRPQPGAAAHAAAGRQRAALHRGHVCRQVWGLWQAWRAVAAERLCSTGDVRLVPPAVPSPACPPPTRTAETSRAARSSATTTTTRWAWRPARSWPASAARPTAAAACCERHPCHTGAPPQLPSALSISSSASNFSSQFSATLIFCSDFLAFRHAPVKYKNTCALATVTHQPRDRPRATRQ